MTHEYEYLLEDIDLNRFASSEEIAEKLGINARTIRHWHSQGSLRGYRIGEKILRFKWRDVLDLVTSKGGCDE